MMSDFRKVVNYEVTSKRIPFMIPDKYKINTNVTKYKRINKIIGWVIDKFKKWKILDNAVDFKIEMGYHEVTIDYRNLANYLHGQMEYMQYRGEEIESIILGNKQMSEVLHCKDLEHCLHLMMGDEGAQQYGLWGIRLILNPYIDGIVFLPKNR